MATTEDNNLAIDIFADGAGASSQAPIAETT